MVTAARGRPLIEMGSRRTHEEAAVAAARAAYPAGFASTSNLAAGRRYGIPTPGAAAHPLTLLPDDAQAAFDSGDLSVLAQQSRDLLDELGATETKIVVSGDLDEYAIASLAAEPVDVYGAGTAVVTGSGAPTAGLVYKLVEVDGRPVVKRSENKATVGRRKTAVRRHKPTGTAVEEVVVSQGVPDWRQGDRVLQQDFLVGGAPVGGLPTLRQGRDRLRDALISIPWEGLKLSAGDPAIPVVFG